MDKLQASLGESTSRRVSCILFRRSFCLRPPQMNFADLFPSMASAIISAQNGAFDASSAVMFLMGKTATAFGISLAAVMLSYLSVPLTLVVLAALLFPDT